MDSHDEIIQKGMALALTMDAYVDMANEMGLSEPPGFDFSDVVKQPSRAAIEYSYNLTGRIEERLNTNLMALFYAAAKADGEDPQGVDREYVHEFGHYLAMESLGHGVSWIDNHPTPEGVDWDLPSIENTVSRSASIRRLITNTHPHFTSGTGLDPS